MFEAARQVFSDYLFEYGVDPALFSAPTVTDRTNGDKSYKWITKGARGIPVGVEVIVNKRKSAKPEWVLIGGTDAWLPLVGSKDKK